MNKIIIGMVALVCAVFAGCKTLPTPEEMSDLGYVSGITTAYVLNNQIKVNDEVRNAIIEIMPKVEKYIPQTNETFCSTWTPIVKEYTDKLVKEDKMTRTNADRVVKDFSYITSLLDAYLEKKGVREYQNLTDAFIHSFCASFLTNFKPANSVSASNSDVKLDKFTLDYLSAISK